MTARLRSFVASPRELALRVGAPVLFLILVVALWQLSVTQGWVSDLLVPEPTEFATAFVELVTGSLLWPNFWATLWETVAGFFVGSALGILLAVASSLSVFLRQMLYPYVVALQVTPRIAIAPILIAWLGFGYTPKIVLAATIVFFPVFINVLTGMVTVDKDALEMFRSMRATRLQEFLHLRLPSALPVTFAGLKIGMTLALIGAVVGEFISANEGLGLLLIRFSSQAAMDSAMAVLAMLTLIGLFLYVLMELLDRMVVFWYHDGRLAARTRKRAARAGGRGMAGAAAGPAGAREASAGPPPAGELGPSYRHVEREGL